MYVLAPNQTVLKYPYSDTDLRRDNPQTSFPKVISAQIRAAFGVFPVVDPGKPTHDSMTQSVDEFPPAFVESSGRWERLWAVRAATLDEIEQRKNAVIEDFTNRTQDRLDTFAQTRGYDGIMSAATYADSSVPSFAAEGAYCKAQRDATWITLLGILNDVNDGLRAIPTWEQVEAELPVLEWPAN